MERLIIHSNPTTPSKLTHTSPFLFTRKLNSSRKLAATPFPSFSPLRRRLSCSNLRQPPYAAAAISPKPIVADDDDNSSFQLVQEDSAIRSVSSTPNFLNLVSQKLSHHLKAVNAGRAILLSAIFLTIFHPAVVSPALASFPSAATAGAGRTLIGGELLSSAWAGLFAGCLHTLSGPDHLAALAPLAIGRTRMESAAVGALWGCGHDAGQVLFGLLFLLLKDRLHIEIFRTWGTVVVGLTLFVIGAMGIKEASEAPAPCLATETGGYGTVSSPVIKKKKVGLATFATGIVHGLQPDALLIILPALALPSRVAGAAFLGMFLVGTVVAMGSYTVFINSCSQALKDRVPKITEKLTWASSFVALGLGLTILISQFFGLGLY